MKSNTLFYCISLVLLSTSQVKVVDATECPKGSTDVLCIEIYDPVKCGINFECVYDNQCFATAASNEFTAETCKKVPLCPPESSNDEACIGVFDPVKCSGENIECEYSNQCFATTASSNFTADTCNKVWVNPLVNPNCPGSSNDEACIAIFDPVKCNSENMECQYSNQCFATTASSNFTAETCNKICPISSSRLTCLETYDPVICGECEYDNQCFAEAASIYFTSETCNTVINTESTSGVTRAYSRSCTLFLSFTLIGVIAIG
ncbi:predicted protein [Chaetoceros tenuissimus]|uniref:ShKT domain-containing protein n=1 Tax=Chaetoceros tenuissimus TaxID=426638 RepID=A0AAD3CSZ2_9STRA|nr:predicted protein [Chaetoceros tenuissimus]